MSSSEMRKLMETMAPKQINEGYEGRIAQAANLLSGKTKTEVIKTVQQDLALTNNGAFSHTSELLSTLPELRLKSKTSQEALRDLIKYMISNRMLGRTKSASMNRAPYYVMSDINWDDRKVPVTHEDIAELGNNLLNWAGSFFPDGDPNDAVMEWMRRKGWDITDGYDKIMPIAAKKYLGKKTYNEYLADIWDDVYRDAKADHDYWANSDPTTRGPEPHMYQQLGSDGASNPWR